jgi:hypothetical protein
MATKDLALTPALERILVEAIYPFHFVTADQVTQLLYAPGALNGVKAHLKRLADGGYLDRFYLPTGYNLRPYVYMLGRKGKEYFQEEKGWEVPKLPKLSVMQTRSHSFLMHLLETNSVIIAAKLLEKRHPSVYLERFEHDMQLKATPFTAITAGKKISVIPDAVLDVRVRIPNTTKKNRRLLWIELERGTNNERDVLGKLSDIYEVLDREVFQQRYNTYNIKVCYLTTAGNADMERLRRLTRKMLQEKREHVSFELNQLFNFLALSPLGNEIDVRALFLHSSWLHPFGNEYSPLIEVNK